MLNSHEFMNRLVGSCPDGIIGVNREGKVIIFNQAAEKLTGLPASQVLGQLSITQVYNPPELARLVKKALYGEANGGHGRVDGMEVEVVDASGRAIPIRLSATLLMHNGQEVGSVGFFHDMTEHKQLEQELRLSSITDSLTGLFNRRHFHAILSREVDRSHRYGRPLTLAFLDMDGFKRFNDTYGHQEGDNILRLVGQVMNESLRAMDQAFRLGGDEFSFILVETSDQQGLKAMERFRQTLNRQWRRKLAYLGENIPPVTMSVGVAQLAPEERGDQLIRRADLAMYEAKKDGGDRALLARVEIKN